MEEYLEQLKLWYTIPPTEGGIYQGSFTKSIGKYIDSDGIEIECQFDVIKSAIQKYIRRGELVKTYQFLCLGFLFALSSKPKAKGMITNLINRLRVITLEDIGIGNYQMIEIVDKLLIEFYQTRVDWVQRLCILMTIVKNLVESKKIRLASWVKSIYDVPISRINPKFPHKSEAKEIYQYLIDNNLDLYNQTDDSLEKGDLSYFMTISNIYHGPKIKREEELEKVWKKLEDMTRNTYLEKPIVILKQWQKPVKYGTQLLNFPELESNLPIFQAILLVLNIDQLQQQTIPKISRLERQLVEDWVFSFFVGLLNNQPLLIDNYVLDIHTRIGRNRGATKLDFAEQGSIVTNAYYGKYTESQINRFIGFYQINKLVDSGQINLENYQTKIPEMCSGTQTSKDTSLTQLRNLSDIIGESSDFFHQYQSEIPLYTLDTNQYQDLVRNQILGQMPIGRKMMTYIFQDYVVKGPYLLENQKFQLNLKNTKALSLLEKEYKIKEKNKSCIPWSSILKKKDKYYLVNKNMGSSNFKIDKTPNTKDETKLQKIESGQWTIIARGSMVNRASEIDPTREQGIAIMQHLYFRFILGIGDTPLVNILICHKKPQLIVGIDMEEKPIKYRKYDTRIDTLFERGSKKTKQKYQIYLDEIVIIADNDIPKIVSILEPIYTHDELQEIKKNIQYYNLI